MTKQEPFMNIPFMKEVTVINSYENTDTDLVLLCDTNQWSYVLDESDTFNPKSCKSISIDHHTSKPDDFNILINDSYSSATEQMIYLMKELFGKRYSITKEISQLGQLGIISDTNRFLYKITKPSTYLLMSELTEIYSLNIEEFTLRINKMPINTLKALTILFDNIHIENDMLSTYISREELQEKGVAEVELKAAVRMFRDEILRYIQGVHWGYVISPEREEDWAISFRSSNGYQEVKDFAAKLGGGGHDLAAGAKIKGGTIQEALKRVNDVISL
jgi:phosphoesterase RecJ-like protein